MGMMISKTTGKMYGSQSDYLENEILPAMKRIRIYADANISSKLFRTVTDHDSLVDAIRKTTGSANVNLARQFERTDVYREMVEENRVEKSERVAEEKVQRETRLSYSKERAKKEKLIFVGRDSRKRLYAYDYELKKRISAQPYRHSKVKR